MRRVLILLPLLVVGGCLSPESYAQKQAKLSCQWTEECAKALFEANYSSMSDCIDTVSQQEEDQNATCEFDREQGKECLAAVRRYNGECVPNAAEVEEIGRECSNVYYSCGALNN
jgi:hypothetical protein